MHQHYLRGLPFFVSEIYYFEVRCSFVAIKILLCRSREMKQGCRLARLFGKSIKDFYARNQYCLMNTQHYRTGFVFALVFEKQKCKNCTFNNSRCKFLLFISTYQAVIRKRGDIPLRKYRLPRSQGSQSTPLLIFQRRRIRSFLLFALRYI